MKMIQMIHGMMEIQDFYHDKSGKPRRMQKKKDVSSGCIPVFTGCVMRNSECYLVGCNSGLLFRYGLQQVTMVKRARRIRNESYEYGG